MRRAPRLRVLADGEALPGVLGASVTTGGRAGARFRVHLAGRDAPAPDARIAVELDGATTLLGRADSAVTDLAAGTTELDGRDLSALLVEARTAELFPNRTAGEVARSVAARHGLQAEVTGEGSLAGRLYGREHGRLLLPALGRARSDWDLLHALAEAEGFALHVEGDTLHFGPPADEEPVALDAKDCASVRLNRQLALSRGIGVTVQSWGTEAAAVVTARAGRGTRQVLVRPNLQPAQAQALADRTLADLMRHERTVDLALPGEAGVTARRRVALSGAGGWDGTYAVLSLHRSLDVRAGYVERVRLGGV